MSDFKHFKFGTPTHVYRYGEAQVVCRYEHDGRKEIAPWALTDGVWKMRSADKPRPLYRAMDLLTDPSARVIVVEGEKCVERLLEMQIKRAPTTWPGGAQAAKHADWSPLYGRDVLLFPDHDQPGSECMEWIAAHLTENGAKVTVINHVADELPDGWDIADEAWSAQELNDWAKDRIRPWAPKVNGAHRGNGHDRDDEPPPADDDYVPRGATFEPPEPEDWGTPTDLWAERPVKPLELSCLPCALQDFVGENSDLMGVDPTVIGMSALVACASVIDDRIRVQPKAHDTSWTEPARLWAAIVGTPSTKKSPGMGAAVKPLKAIEARLAEQQKEDLREWDEAVRAWNAKRGKEKGAPPAKPPSARTYTSNTTVEALSDILADNEQGVLCFSDELSAWFGSMGVYARGNANKDKGLWLEAYNGGPQRIDRVQRGHIYVPNWSVCMLGGIQPDVFKGVARAMDNDGLLQRFMIVMATRSGDEQDRPPKEETVRDYYGLVRSLRDLRPTSDIVYRLEPEAQELRKQFMAAVDASVSPMLPRGMEGYLGKWSGLFARLLCAYHVIDAIGAHKRPAETIPYETAARVQTLMESVLYPHAMAFYDDHLGEADQWQHVRWIAGHILAKKLTAFATRDITIAYRTMRSLQDRAKADCFTTLQECGWIRGAPGHRVNGYFRVPTRWDVNQAVHEVFNKRTSMEIVQRDKSRHQLVDNLNQSNSELTTNDNNVGDVGRRGRVERG